MARFDLSLDIARPPEDVFAYLTDVARLPEWQSTARSAEADGPLRKGSQIREQRQFLGREVTAKLEVTSLEPSSRFAVTSRVGPVSFAIDHRLEPSASGTRLEVEVDVRMGAMMRIAAQGPLKLAEREFRADFARLKEILESE